jgi:hypothetical protein
VSYSNGLLQFWRGYEKAFCTTSFGVFDSGFRKAMPAAFCRVENKRHPFFRPGIDRSRQPGRFGSGAVRDWDLAGIPVGGDFVHV